MMQSFGTSKGQDEAGYGDSSEEFEPYALPDKILSIIY